MSWRVHILTLFPNMFPGPLMASLSGKALQEGLWHLHVHNIRESATDKHKTVDDTPFGGGPGMVMRPDVVHQAITQVVAQCTEEPHFIYLTPRGTLLKQTKLQELSQIQRDVLILCGHYEGVDQRVLEAWPFEEISVGDFILSGGEMAAFILLDGIVRLLPGVIGDATSLVEESFSASLLEYPHYTRPQEWNQKKVPEVLLSGHHHNIACWRRQQAERLTQERRPDLWAQSQQATSLPISTKIYQEGHNQ